MSRCDQEMCSMWDGEGCPCAAFGIDRDDLPTSGVYTTTRPTRGCRTCLRGDHDLCTGLDGPMTTHPDSLPRCGCTCHERTTTMSDTITAERALEELEL